MKSLLRLVACLLSALLFFGCAGIRACIRAEEPDASNAERDALWEQLLSERPDTPPVSDPVLTVVFLDVGQGDCVFLSAPDGQTMLVDAGPVGSYPAIAETLACYGVDSLDVVVATHPHTDHIGAMADVLDAWPAGTFCTTEQTLSMGGDLNRAIEQNGCDVAILEAMQQIPWSETCTVTVLNPIPAYDPPDDPNDASAVIRVQFGDTAVLLTGDAGEEAEQRILDTFPRSMLRADVLKLGHHGSRYSTGYSFFLAVSPDYAVASCGKDNEYGHPHADTLSLLYVTHTALYRTDQDGTITFRFNGADVSVEPTRKELP